MLSWKDIHEIENIDSIVDLDCTQSMKGALTLLGHDDAFAWGALYGAYGFNRYDVLSLEIKCMTEFAEHIHAKAVENGTVDNLRKLGEDLEREHNGTI